jgi:hypothetical protein
MAGWLRLTLADYRLLEGGELTSRRISTSGSWSCAVGLARRVACQTWAVSRLVTVRRGRRWGWWVEERKGSGGLFMRTWWPTEGMARAIGRWIGGDDASP